MGPGDGPIGVRVFGVAQGTSLHHTTNTLNSTGPSPGVQGWLWWSRGWLTREVMGTSHHLSEPTPGPPYPSLKVP